MNYKAKSIRTFIGTEDYKLSQKFYQELGFQCHPVGDKMSYIKVNDQLGFFLQDYYVEDWVNNSMIFLEVEDIEACYKDLTARKLKEKYKKVKLSEIKTWDWGREIFLHDPAGVLWHFGQFNE